MLSVFKRMGKGILAVMGEDSLLRGAVPCKVNIEHSVDVYGDDGVSIYKRSVATIDADAVPKVGDVLTHPDGTYKLDAPYQDNGVNPRFVLITYTP